MKIIKILPFLLIIFILIFLAVSRIYAQQGFPTITTACENRSGLLWAFDDGFSVFKKCPSNSRRVVIIGEKGDKGEKGDPLVKQDRQGLLVQKETLQNQDTPQLKK